MTHRRHFDLCICSCAEDGGLVRAALDAETGEIRRVGKTPLDLPMYAIKRGDRLLAVTRCGGNGNNGALFSFSAQRDMPLRLIDGGADTGGVVPCHLDACDNDIYVVNYLSGNVQKMGEKCVVHTGRGPHPTRQEAPHTHCVRIAPDERRVLVTDLGLDTVFVYSRELDLLSSARVPSGYGARHMVFSDDGKTLFVANELVSSVTVFDYDGALTPRGTYAAAPEGISGNTAAAIRLVGRELFVSNRGHDSVAVFDVDGGELRLKRYLSSFGREPRDFDIFGRFAVCTDQMSDRVTVVDRNTGDLVSTLDVISPLCITEI